MIVFMYVDGSLADMLTDEDGYAYPMDGDQALYYLQQILSGVQFVHHNNILHLDICGMYDIIGPL